MRAKVVLLVEADQTVKYIKSSENQVNAHGHRMVKSFILTSVSTVTVKMLWYTITRFPLRFTQFKSCLKLYGVINRSHSELFVQIIDYRNPYNGGAIYGTKERF